MNSRQTEGAAGPWRKVGTFEPDPDALYIVQGSLRTSLKRGSMIERDHVAAALLHPYPQPE